MRIAIVNPITQTSPDRWSLPSVESNYQCIAVQLARALVRARAEVVVVAAEPYRPRVADEGVQVEYLPVVVGPLSPPAQLPRMPRLAAFIMSGDFDVVLASEVFQWATLDLARLALGEGPPLLVWHEADRYQRLGLTLPARAFYAIAGQQVFSAATGVLPRSGVAAEFLVRAGLPSEKLGPEVPNGFDASVFTPRRELRHPAPRLVYSGSLIERKNPDLPIRALGLVREQLPDATLRIKGAGSLETELRTLARSLGLEQAVQFDVERSSLAEMAAVYNEGWVALFPSERDFATLSPMESAACGVPVVVSDRLAHASFVRQAGIGLVSPNDVTSIAAAVSRVVGVHGRDGIDDASVAVVHAAYGLDGVARRLLDYIEVQVLGRSSGLAGAE